MTTHDHPGPCTPLGAVELAALAGVKDQTVRRWRMLGRLPEATWTVGGRELWCVEVVRPWVAARGTTD